MYILLSNNANLLPMVVPTSIKPAFTPTKKIKSPIKAYKNPVINFLSSLLLNLKNIFCKTSNIITKGKIAIKLSFIYWGIIPVNDLIIEAVLESSTSSAATNSSVFENIPRSITDIAMPVAVTATSPKLSLSDASLSLFNFDILTEIAKIKGTTSIPVVEAAASNEIAINSREENIASINKAEYTAIKTLFREIL